jgi:hypothetical protein
MSLPQMGQGKIVCASSMSALGRGSRAEVEGPVVSGRTLLGMPVRETHPAESIVPVRSYRAVKLPRAHYFACGLSIVWTVGGEQQEHSNRAPALYRRFRRARQTRADIYRR